MDVFISKTLFGLAGSSVILNSFTVFSAHYLPYILVLGIIIFISRRKSWKEKMFVTAFVFLPAIVARGILANTIKFLYERPRPFVSPEITQLVDASGSAFPSGHASLLFALALAVFIIDRRWGWWYLALASINGIARVAAGVHWPSDIIGGVVVAILSVWLIYVLLKPSLQDLGLTRNSK